MKGIKLTVIGLVGALALLNSTRPVARAGAQQEVQVGPVEILGRGTALPERVGSDDGVQFVIHFSGDMHGNLDTCG